MKDDIYKPSPDWEEEYKEALAKVMENIKKDPLYLGTLLYLLKEERETTNRLLKTIIQRLEILEKKLEGKEKGENKKIMLSETDKKIVEFVKQRGKVTSYDLMKAFGYKGQNGASARLNRLYTLGVLKKSQAGKKVYYYIE